MAKTLLLRFSARWKTDWEGRPSCRQVPPPTKNIYDVLKVQHVNGINIAVTNNDTLAWAKAYGIADRSKNSPVTTETLCQGASIGKIITAVAALHLVRESRLTLDENVNDKLTTWKVADNEFTRGIPDRSQTFKKMKGDGFSRILKLLLDLLKSSKFVPCSPQNTFASSWGFYCALFALRSTKAE